MTLKSKIITVILAGGALFAVLWYWNAKINNVDCLKISTAIGVNNCAGGKIKAAGKLMCEDSSKINGKIVFKDGTSLPIFRNVDCLNYQNKNIEIAGDLLKCQENDQCAGTGINNVEYINLGNGKVNQQLRDLPFDPGPVY